MSDQNNGTSLRGLAKQIGVSHTTLVKISNGTYNANPQKIFKRIISHINGVVIPADRYQDILDMLEDSSFPKFGDTSRTASWLFEVVDIAKNKVDK